MNAQTSAAPDRVPPPAPGGRQLADLVRDTGFDPVFIIGDHRSGTTVLYQALFDTGAFNAVTAYHVICNSVFLESFVAGREDEARRALARRFVGLGLTDRGIDGVKVTPDLPEEYGFVIDRSLQPRLRPATLPALVDLCRRIQFTRGPKPILLKNPWDVLGFAFVRQAFPQAKLIFIHRHPLNVMSSQVAAMRSLLAGKNEYVALLSPWYREMFEHPLRLRLGRLIQNSAAGPRMGRRHLLKVARYYEEHIESVRGPDCVEIRYEDFCAAPGPTIARLLRFLGLENSAGQNFSDMIRPRKTSVPPDVRQQYRRIQGAIAPYCARLGYDIEP